jgi:hypothetical protein
MEPDLNRYGLVHVTTRHATMSDQVLQDIYSKAWDLYYSPEHVERVIRRTQGCGHDPRDMMAKLFSVHAAMKVQRLARERVFR